MFSHDGSFIVCQAGGSAFVKTSSEFICRRNVHEQEEQKALRQTGALQHRTGFEPVCIRMRTLQLSNSYGFR